VLIAEEFVLMALDPDGTAARSQSAAAVGVTGALVAELVHDGHLTLDDGRIHLTGTKPQHRLLIQALEGLKSHEGKKLKTTLGSIKHAGWSEVVDSMIAAGDLSRDKQAFRATRHPILDPHAQDLLLAALRGAAVGDGPLDRRMATLLALAGACRMLEVVAPKRGERKKAKQRIKEATDQVPVAAAVKYAIDAQAVVVVG
jgi:polyhydroxyalkanoate synthesis regulator phasin